MVYEDFINNVFTSLLGGTYMDWKLTYETLQKVSGKVYEDFFEKLESREPGSLIDPVATVYSLVVESALDELDEIIKDIIKQYCDKSGEDFKEVMQEYEDAKSQVGVYRSYSDTEITDYDDLGDFLDRVLKKYNRDLDCVGISKTLTFFLEEIEVLGG